jgi:hypothetical protein
MSTATSLVQRLFGAPGDMPRGSDNLAEQAASAHANLLARAARSGDPALTESLGPIQAFLRGRSPPAQRRRLLCHPALIEGLHTLAPFSSELERWHDCVAPPRSPPCADRAGPAARASLGNVSLILRLRADGHWQGVQHLATDVLGRISFPFSDWSLTLHNDQGDFLGSQLVTVSLDQDQACWRLGDSAEPPFLILSRDDCLRMLVDNTDPRERRRLQFPNERLKPRLQCASPLGQRKIRYEPIGMHEREDHAALTGGLVQQVLASIRRHSPSVYREFGTFVYTVRGFELPPTTYGVVASFSDPTLPGVMGVNVCYTPQHEPCADPLCFTWFGHELGHTKNYLSDNILYDRGETLLQNAADWTEIIPRYGRPLAVRTLFQVPYVHLYEWTLLMDFWQGGFRGLPWRRPADVAELGDDLEAEIEEAFTLMEDRAQLTPLGEAALSHFKELFARAQARWQSVLSRRLVAVP